MAQRQPIQLEAQDIQSCINKYDTLLLDCDGVLWSNDMYSKFEGIAATIKKLRDMGKQIFFVSNNPTYTKENFMEKFHRLAGFEGVPDEVISVADACVTYLKNIAKIDGKVFVVGPQAVSDTVTKSGLEALGVGPSPEPMVGNIVKNLDQVLSMKLEDNVQAVIVTTDPQFDYNKWFKAANYLQNPNCTFLATSHESQHWIGTGDNQRMLPIAGAMVTAIEAGSGREAVVIGKPSVEFFKCVTSQHPHVDPKHTVMIGDSLASDIKFAANCGMDSILVSTGTDNEHTVQEALAQDPETSLPTYIIGAFADLGK